MLPWKYNHLLPGLLMLLLWLGASRATERPFLWLVIGALAINGLVTFRPLAPDAPAVAEAGRWDPALTAGLLVNDIAAGSTPCTTSRRSRSTATAWACTLKPMRGSVDTETAPDGTTVTPLHPSASTAVRGVPFVPESDTNERRLQEQRSAGVPAGGRAG